MRTDARLLLLLLLLLLPPPSPPPPHELCMAYRALKAIWMASDGALE